MQGFLKKHGATVACHSIKVSWQKEGDKVSIHFVVQKRNGGQWRGDPAFSKDYSKNWGLWNTDVLEAFLQLRETSYDVTFPYLEIQVSPLNQPFALVVTEPRKKYFAPEALEFKTSVLVEERVWRASIEVMLPPELKGSELHGGFFACLGDGPREYYALEPNPESTPDFHRPELFVNLDGI